MNLKTTFFSPNPEMYTSATEAKLIVDFAEADSLSLKSHIFNSLCLQGSKGEVYSVQQSFGKLSGSVNKVETADLCLVCGLVLITPRSLWELSSCL